VYVSEEKDVVDIINVSVRNSTKKCLTKTLKTWHRAKIAQGTIEEKQLESGKQGESTGDGIALSVTRTLS
jgi:hypothetical protein